MFFWSSATDFCFSSTIVLFLPLSTSGYHSSLVSSTACFTGAGGAGGGGGGGGGVALGFGLSILGRAFTPGGGLTLLS